MANSNPRTRRGNSTAGDNVSVVGSAAKQETFPLIPISLEVFVKNGSAREFRQLVFELMGLFNQMRRHSDQFARYIGTNNAQFHVIMIMAQTPDVTVGQVAHLMNVKSQLVTIEIGKLIRKGIIEKRPNASDRRSSFLNLTSKGKNLVREVAPLVRRASDLHFRSLTEDRARTLREILHAIVEDGRRVIHELASPDVLNAVAPSALSYADTRSNAPQSTRGQPPRRQ